ITRATLRRAPARPVPPDLLPAGRRAAVRNLLDDAPWRGGDGLQLRADGSHRPRPAGAVGGLAGRVATTGPRDANARGTPRMEAVAGMARRTTDTAVATPRRRAPRRPWHGE